VTFEGTIFYLFSTFYYFCYLTLAIYFDLSFDFDFDLGVESDDYFILQGEN
jgi:hypothetical protein